VSQNPSAGCVAMFGAGNLDALDPLFSPTFSLMTGSPCIDAGDNTAVPPDVLDLDRDGNTAEPTPVDLNGLPRFQEALSAPNTGNPGPQGPPIVDIGAFEFGLVP
ncbi:MAG TPA: choice-of-anchor Q domain-containing protein, partial [Phycisphaerae bacterium]